MTATQQEAMVVVQAVLLSKDTPVQRHLQLLSAYLPVGMDS